MRTRGGPGPGWLLRAAADESRRLIGGLRPPALDELGIVEAIESLVADARIEIPRVEFVHELPEDRLPDALETVIFRVVQEALTNSRRHSRAKSAEVRVEQVPGGVHVLVRDDGRGFKPAAAQDRHFGLEGIRQRCRLFGASPTIVSAPRRGTTVEVTLPLPGPEVLIQVATTVDGSGRRALRPARELRSRRAVRFAR